jgi:predicted component of type VI protein secretion system
MRPGRRGGPGASTRTQLVLVDNGGTPTLPATIILTSGSLRIGRDPAVSNAVLDDRRISRFHCQIREEVGGYRILDEGSTSGTYVNDMEVSMQGHLLQPGDLVGIGPVVYRFEASAAPGPGPVGPQPPPNPRDSTVPLLPHHP